MEQNLAIKCPHEAGQQPWGSSAAGLLAQAAAEIERLRAALHQIACGDWMGVGPTPKDAVYAQDIARAALDGVTVSAPDEAISQPNHLTGNK